MTDPTPDPVVKKNPPEMAVPGSHATGYLLWQVTNLWQKAQKDALAPFDLTPVQYLLLAGLKELGEDLDQAGGKRGAGSIKQSDLAQQCHTDAMMTSQVIRALEKRSLVQRATHESDGRAIAVQLTDDGLQRLNQAAPAAALADAHFFAGLGDRVDEFADALALLTGEKRRRRVKAIGQ
jgi:DNA-binding MarR family transcriptional regulator